MTIRVALRHETAYTYDRPISLAPQLIRLRPAPHARTPVLSYSLQVEPSEHFENWQQDPHGNFLARCVFPKKTREFRVGVDLVADMTVINPFDFFVEPSAETWPFEYEPWLTRDLRPYLERDEPGPLLSRRIGEIHSGEIQRKGENTIDFLVDLNRRLEEEIRYLIRMEPGVQSPEETLEKRSGSCRDTAWLFVQILRGLGVAARFTSGYLIQLAPDLKALDGPSGPEADFTDLHAWTEAYIPGAGWIGLDPTSGLLAGEGHIPLACTPEPSTAAPISGDIEACESTFDFDMSVTRIHEDPRVTKPYSDQQWERICSVGEAVDGRLEQDDVRLTMGGEPTFVSIDDMDGAEWTVEAVGPDKRLLAEDLLKRLQRRFAPGGLLHFGQGKWYPGEPLPRWAFTCLWRTDGEPLWRDTELIAEEGVDYGSTHRDAHRFVDALTETLQLDADCAIAAYEDVWHHVEKERRLPVNVDVHDNKLDDPEERARMARVFEGKLTDPIGFVLPLRRQWWQAKPRWVSNAWPLRTEHLFLLPGDSPIGLRLPLDSLPWSEATEDFTAQDPTTPRGPLPPTPSERVTQRSVAPQGAPDSRVSAEVQSAMSPTAGGVSRAALCVEPRGGQLHVFMPPTERLEDYLDLVNAVEAAAKSSAQRVVVEGYLPPEDHRLHNVKVTPDPGVIEVNTQPASSWKQLVDSTTALYEEAREARLGTEKFDIDGRHTGTGGGNHVVLGGPSPADSPFLRRPDLLKSLIAYWNNHPSLSYLFSGTFIGPTSQAPRVDEGRRDALYELEIAFEQVPAPETEFPLWLTDRIFRNLLVDVTGNTHRAEFCIDKLYSPDSSTGRLGLVEFRGLEMPPHARMSLTQQLLLRALIARFWKEPYTESLVHWGTTLHDRFLLPQFVWSDFSEVIASTRTAGIELEREWFAAHFDFRFPRIGTVEVAGLEVELRQAIEPWYVLGEEPGASGTTRYVDSSVERLQVRVQGMTDSRHLVTCNRRRVPLHSTGTEGEYVGAVRYRAWQPPSCLHPAIPVHAPLTIDVFDTWNRRSVGGCVYHTTHPAGRNYESFPVNANEADARRAARFFASGHRSWQLAAPRVGAESTLPVDPGPATRYTRLMSDLRDAPVSGNHNALFADYDADASYYDEVFSDRAVLRPHWEGLLGSLDAIGRAELTRRWRQTQEELHTAGVARNIYEDSVGIERPWQLDLLPQLFDTDEWSTLARGLEQRARLLNRILVDLYGPQELLSRDLLPPELLFSHPGFQRVFHGQQANSGTLLHFYAADLARAPDGTWWVVGDRTDAPLGIGYALENRIVAARMLPDVFREQRVERLAPFFVRVRQTLRTLAEGRENPRIVLLSHGPRGPSYFEDAYLARYLGYTLVEGGDLAVRNDRVFMKTLAGLLPVDVILRRLSDQYCDPLELQTRETLGVPGLLQAARRGRVAIVNALGTSLVESPALMPFLPEIAKELLGEELQLPSVATWWCGQEAARTAVEDQLRNGGLSRIALRPAYRVGRMEARAVTYANSDEAMRLLSNQPQDLIAQELVSRSTSPVLWDGPSARWHIALRAYVVASEGTYHAMPGALVRLARKPERLDRSVLGGSLTQDAWIRSRKPVEQVSLLAAADRVVVLRRSGAELPSRVADNLFWLGRQIERSQGLCRLLRQTVTWLTGEAELQAGPELEYLSRCLAAPGHADPAAEDADSLRRLAVELPRRAVDAANPGSLRSLLSEAHRNASLVRDRLSLDSWRVIHEIERKSFSAASSGSEAPFGLVELDVLLDELILLTAAFDGLVAESMTRTPAWRFLDLGGRLERSMHIANLVQALTAQDEPTKGRVLEVALEVADSVMTYRSRYLEAFSTVAVLDLLLTDETNPRSLRFQLEAICSHIANLPRDTAATLGSSDERVARALLHAVRMLDVGDLTLRPKESTRLERLLHDIGEGMPKLSDLVSHRYLVHAGRAQQMSERESSRR